MLDEKKLLGMVGMSKRAGKTVTGTPMICEHLRKRGVTKEGGEIDVLVIEASDTSENTHKKITDKCTFYNVKHVRIETTCENLGRAVGKSAVAAVAVADINFCRGILSILERDQ